MAVHTLDQNLLQSPKPQKGEAPVVQTTSSNSASMRKRIFKIIAYTVFFLWSLAFFTFLKIPDSVVANFLLNSLNQNTPYQWQAEKIGLSFFPLPHLQIEKLGLEPKFPGGGIPLFLDELRIYPNPFSMIPLGGKPAVGGSFKANLYQSAIHGSIATGSNTSLRVETSALDLARFTPISRGGMDLKGNITNLYLQVALPGQRLAMANGEINLQGKNVVFDPASLQLPMALPILNLGDVDIKATVNRGQVKFEKFKLGSPGKDLEVQIPNGTMMLADVMQNTRYELHLLIKPSAAIQSAMPGLIDMLKSMATAKPDGFYAMKLQGTFMAPGFPVKD